MKKVIVIGCPGAGKSTFSRRLNRITDIKLYYLDMLWHKPDKTNVSREEFDNKLEEIFIKDSWIIDGNYQRTLEKRIEACDTVFLLDYPLEVCIAGATSRIGTIREELPWVEEELDENFKERIISFSKEKLPKVYDLLEKYKDSKNIVIFKGREDAIKYLDDLVNEYKKDWRGYEDQSK